MPDYLELEAVAKGTIAAGWQAVGLEMARERVSRASRELASSCLALSLRIEDLAAEQSERQPPLTVEERAEECVRCGRMPAPCLAPSGPQQTGWGELFANVPLITAAVCGNDMGADAIGNVVNLSGT